MGNSRRGRRTFGRSRRLSALVLLMTGLLLVECRSGSEPADPNASTTTDSVTSSTAPSAQSEVAAAWRRFWDVYLAASNPMNPQDPRLREVATGEELKTLTSAFLASKSSGEVYKGSIELRPAVPEVSGDTATLSDCYLSSILAYDAQSGVLRDRHENVRRLVTASLVKEGGVWKVARIRHERDGCVPAS